MLNIVNECYDPFYNLALEEYVFKELGGSRDYFMLWSNQPAVILGRYQNTLVELDKAFADENKISIVRRITGGGTVYHDSGNLNYSIIVTSGEDVRTDYRRRIQPIINALVELGVRVELTERNDLTVEGKKFSGSAHACKRNRILHHGTLLFDSNLEILQKVLAKGIDGIEARGIKSIQSSVANIKDYLKHPMNIHELKRILERAIYKADGTTDGEYALTGEDLKGIDSLYRRKYLTWEWNYGEDPPCSVKLRKKCRDGDCEMIFHIKHGLVEGCEITGGDGHRDAFSAFAQSVKGERWYSVELPGFPAYAPEGPSL